ncbi:MAG: hypothetical protein ABIH82_03545 [Candidatus Woesearchaeota archaeon]
MNAPSLLELKTLEDNLNWNSITQSDEERAKLQDKLRRTYTLLLKPEVQIDH